LSRGTWVQPLSVVDKSDFCPSGLTVPSNTPYYQEALPVSYFKRRGMLWLSTFSCFCSCFSFSYLSRCFVSCGGPITVLPSREPLLRYAPRSPVCSSPARQTIALPVVSPPLPRQLEGHRLCQCGPGARSKAGEELLNA
jgi:hypothetical protein